MEKSLICIGCPMGCMLSAEVVKGEVVSVKGNTCRRGEIYAKKELTNPTRIVTSTVRVYDGTIGAVSVKTESDIPKEKIAEIVAVLASVTVNAPVCCGDVIVRNVCGTGVNIVATKNVPSKSGISLKLVV